MNSDRIISLALIILVIVLVLILIFRIFKNKTSKKAVNKNDFDFELVESSEALPSVVDDAYDTTMELNTNATFFIIEEINYFQSDKNIIPIEVIINEKL